MEKRNVLWILIVLIYSLNMSCTKGVPEITIKGPKLVGKGDAAIFLLIINDGNASDCLTSCSIREWPDAQIEIHDVIDGVMQEVKEIEIPPNEIVAFKKGSYHVMIFGVPEDDQKEITLLMNFRESGTKEAKITIN